MLYCLEKQVTEKQTQKNVFFGGMHPISVTSNFLHVGVFSAKGMVICINHTPSVCSLSLYKYIVKQNLMTTVIRLTFDKSELPVNPRVWSSFIRPVVFRWYKTTNCYQGISIKY